MSNPQVSSVELSTGDLVPLSTDPESPITVEIVLYGTDLGDVSSVELDGGSEVVWAVYGVSASANSIVVTAAAFGGEGDGNIVVKLDREVEVLTEVGYVFPLLD